MRTQHSALFKVDFGKMAGGGHVARCASLSTVLRSRGWFTCVTLPPTDDRMFLKKLERLFSLSIISADGGAGSAEALSLAMPQGCDLLVVDDYGCDQRFETACRSWAKTIMVIEDQPNRDHDCDILLDQTFGRRAGDYKNRVPATTVLLCGSHYALLRQEFRIARVRSLKARLEEAHKPKRIFISMGAGDTTDATAVVLEGLQLSGLSMKVDVAFGENSPGIARIRQIYDSFGEGMSFHVTRTDLSTLMASADLGIGAGGVTSLERCCLGLPTILVELFPNQRDIAKNLSDAGAVHAINKSHFTPDAIAEALHQLIDDTPKRSEMVRKAAAITDGLGANRVATLLEAPTTKDGSPVALRPAEGADSDIMLEWQSHPATRRYFRNSKVPTREEHASWFYRKSSDPHALLAIIQVKGQPAGLLQFDHKPDTDSPDLCYEVSILTAPRWRGKGVGRAALDAARMLLPDARLVAEIMPSNDASRRLFEAAGYRPRSDGIYQQPPLETCLATSLRQ